MPVYVHTLEVLFQLDSATGKILHQTEWKDLAMKPNQAGDIQVSPTHDGQFLVMVGPFLKLFSSEFVELRSRTLLDSMTLGSQEFWILSTSYDGQIGFFKHWNSYSQSEDHWFSTDTLDDQLAETVPHEETWRSIIGGSHVYFNPFPSPSQHEPVYVRDRGNPTARPVCSDCYGQPLAVTSDGVLFLGTSPKASFMLVSAQGQIVERRSYGIGVDFAAVATTASSTPRFAFEFGHLQRRLFSFKAVDKIIVFDARKMSDIFRLNIQPRAYKYFGGDRWLSSLFALSPDGDHLAVMNRARLKLFHIP